MASSTDSQAVALAGLGAEFCAAVASCAQSEPRDFCRAVLRYLPRIYITISDLRDSYDSEAELQGADTEAIYASMDEAAYDAARQDMSAIFGEYDVYLDTPAEDMRYSDTPVAVSLSEKLADIYQQMYDMADTVRQAPPQLWPEVMADLKFRFDSFLSEAICDALRAANFIYRKAQWND